MRRLIKNKNAIIGETYATFVAVIFLVLFLIIFVLGAATAKKFLNSKEGTIIDKKNEINFDSYISKYQKYSEGISLVEQGTSVAQAFPNGGVLG